MYSTVRLTIIEVNNSKMDENMDTKVLALASKTSEIGEYPETNFHLICLEKLDKYFVLTSLSLLDLCTDIFSMNSYADHATLYL